MRSYKTLDGLINGLNNYMEDIMRNEIQPYVERKLKESIEAKVYSRPPSDSYSRTYTLLESVDSQLDKTSKGFSIKVFNNPNKMARTTYPSWIPEKYGTDHRQDIVKWVNDGHGMTMGSNDLAPTEPTYFVEDAFNELKRVFAIYLKNELRSRGIQIK